MPNRIRFTKITRMMYRNTLLLIVVWAMLFFQAGCKRDDFSKLAESEWNPDFAFPLVNSTLTASDILAEDNSSTLISVGESGIVEVIYSTTNKGKNASEIIDLPLVNVTNNVFASAINTNAFNSNQTIGTTLNDSVFFNIPYTLDAQLGSISRIDTVFFKAGGLKLDINCWIPHNSILSIEIPELIINDGVYKVDIPFNYALQTPMEISLERNLQGAYLVPSASSESIQVKYTLKSTRINNQDIPITNQFTSNLKFSETEFSKLRGNFGSYAAPLPNNDTLILHLFRNVINAVNLSFTDPSARILVRNSTGIPINYSQTSFNAIRPGSVIPNVDLSSISFPTSIQAMSSTSALPAQVEYPFTTTNGSNISDVINSFPRYMLSRGNFNFDYSLPNASYFLRDTSHVETYSEVTLPLNGLTLDLQVRDTFEYNFNSISGDIEEIMLRLNIENGFPTEGKLQVYFCRHIGTGNSLQIIDSLYTQGTEVVLMPGQTNANGIVTIPSQKITDATISGSKWLKLTQMNADRILIKARLTTNELGELAVKILANDKLQIRIAARVKANKTF